MASELLLDGDGDERWTLGDDDEATLTAVFGALAAYATRPEDAAIIHRREGETIASWDREGALRLARALPPAYRELAGALARRYEREGSSER